MFSWMGFKKPPYPRLYDSLKLNWNGEQYCEACNSRASYLVQYRKEEHGHVLSMYLCKVHESYIRRRMWETVFCAIDQKADKNASE
jgi:hypothetical protein